MRTSRLVLLGILFGAFAVSEAAAGTVTAAQAANSSATGGEFILTTNDIGTFNSFCIELDEQISLGTLYNYTTSDKAQLGGINTNAGDPISIGTAYLYSQFRAGTLVDLSATAYTSTNAQQTALQNAFWMLEDELVLDATNVWIAKAAAALTLTTVQLKGDSLGAYSVVAMNLTKRSDGSPVQSMLAIPDAGGTLALLGMAMTGLGLFSRRRQ